MSDGSWFDDFFSEFKAVTQQQIDDTMPRMPLKPGEQPVGTASDDVKRFTVLWSKYSKLAEEAVKAAEGATPDSPAYQYALKIGTMLTVLKTLSLYSCFRTRQTPGKEVLLELRPFVGVGCNWQVFYCYQIPVRPASDLVSTSTCPSDRKKLN